MMQATTVPMKRQTEKRPFVKWGRLVQENLDSRIVRESTTRMCSLNHYKLLGLLQPTSLLE